MDNYGLDPKTPLNMIEPPLDSTLSQKESQGYLKGDSIVVDG
jgi:hypothetical protein